MGEHATAERSLLRIKPEPHATERHQAAPPRQQMRRYRDGRRTVGPVGFDGRAASAVAHRCRSPRSPAPTPPLVEGGWGGGSGGCGNAVPPLTRPPPPNPSPQGGGEEFAALFVSILRFLM